MIEDIEKFGALALFAQTTKMKSSADNLRNEVRTCGSWSVRVLMRCGLYFPFRGMITATGGSTS